MVVLLKHREMKASRINIHIALEELNFLWDEKDIIWFRRMWNEGMSFRYICEKLRRSEREVLLLALDQKKVCREFKTPSRYVNGSLREGTINEKHDRYKMDCTYLDDLVYCYKRYVVV